VRNPIPAGAVVPPFNDNEGDRMYIGGGLLTLIIIILILVWIL
jgi:hypothetical protein